MKKKIKRYLVFTSFAYRAVMFLIMPVFFAGIGVYAGNLFGVPGMMFTAGFLTMWETISDHWLFPGLQTKEPEQPEFLKTSGIGMEIMQDALILDLTRKFLTAAGILLVCYLITNLPGGCLHIVLVSYAFSVLGTFFSRYGDLLLINLCIGQFTMIFVTAYLLFMLRPEFQKYISAFPLLFLILGILISILTVTKAIRKVKGGYYDA